MGGGAQSQLGMGRKTEWPDPKEIRIEDVVYRVVTIIQLMSQVSLVGGVKGGGRGTKSARYGKENRMARPQGNTNRGCCVSCGYYHTAYVTGESGGWCKRVGGGAQSQLGMGRKTEWPGPEEIRIEDVVYCAVTIIQLMSQVSLVGGVKGWGRGTKSARYGKENRMARPQEIQIEDVVYRAVTIIQLMSQVSLVGGVKGGGRGTKWVRGN